MPRPRSLLILCVCIASTAFSTTTALAGPSLQSGSVGPAVRAIQLALNRAGYPAGSPDGHFGPSTLEAVWAFEKQAGLARDGVVDQREYRQILAAHRPSPPLPGYVNYVYVSLHKQVLYEVHSGKLAHLYPVSTGGGYWYTSEGVTSQAITPVGTFRIGRKFVGWRQVPLGFMYYPSYFFGGFAIHGDTDVPPVPVSHGCVRIPDYVAVGFYDRNPVGTLVIIRA